MSKELDLSILKTLVTNKKQALDFVSECDDKLFTPELWNFASLVVSYIRTYKEVPTLRVMTERLAKNDKLVESIKKVWSQLDKIEHDDKEYKHDLDRLKKRYAEKQVIALKDSLIRMDPDSMDVPKVMGEIQKITRNIKALDQSKSYESKNIKDYLPLFVEKFNSQKNNPKAESGLMTKYSALDYATNGLKNADFLVIAGETGFGKSLMLNNIAIQVWLQDNKVPFAKEQKPAAMTGGKNVIYFSLEMPYEDCFNRLLSRLSGIASRKIENANLSKEEFAKIKTCLDFIKEYPYTFKIVDIADACANDLEAILMDSEEKHDGIFIDYLGIMRPNEKVEEQDWLRQGIIAYEIRAIGRKYRTPMFSAVQLNRKGQGKESSESIGLSRLARSATIATHCTHIIQIESRSGEENRPDFIAHIIKNRKGPRLKFSLIKNLACATLLDMKIEPAAGEENQFDYDKNDFIDINDISEKMDDLEL